MISKKFVLWGIISIALLFRIYALQNIPSHPSLDEVSIGYNAYSILKTGEDEFGNLFPLLLRAYDDYRPAHYTYLVIPFVKILGLSILAVRLPSILLSILTIISVYYLVKKLFSKFRNSEMLALITVGLLAISPWHIYISRLGHEVNLFISTFIFGMTFFFLFLKDNKRYFLVSSSILFAISFSAYQSGKIFIPLMLVTLCVAYYKELFKNKLSSLLSALIFLMITLPILFTSFQPQALIRFKATNIYTISEPLLKNSAQMVMKAKENGDIFSQVINNRRFVYAFLPAMAFVSHLSPSWLFTNGGDEPFKVPNFGLLYIYELPLILIGILYFLTTKHLKRKSKIIIFVWFFASIIPAAITSGFPHAMRSFQILPLPHLFAAFGFLFIFNYAKHRKLLLIISISLVAVSVILFSRSYFMDFPKKTAHQFQYGVLQSLQYVSKYKGNYNEIYISNKGNLFQSYMFYLFFTKYDPTAYQKGGGTVSGGYDKEHTIGKFNFGDLSKHDLVGSLVVSNPKEIGGTRIKTVYFPTGKEALWITKL